MSHLSDIGFPVESREAFQSLAQSVYNKGNVIDSANGYCVKFTDERSGAELWLQFNKQWEFMGMNPHYAGMTHMRVCLTDRMTKAQNAMEGAFHCWANPTQENRPESGAYPFVFDLPDFCAVPHFNLPTLVDIQLTTFAYEMNCFDNEAEFNDTQDSELKYALESFIPIGLFNADDNPTEQAFGFFAARVLNVADKVNELTGEKFLWLDVKTLGCEMDVVCDYKLLNKMPQVGGIIQGQFWLSGRITSSNSVK
jgi:hypothetical protein